MIHGRVQRWLILDRSGVPECSPGFPRVSELLRVLCASIWILFCEKEEEMSGLGQILRAATAAECVVGICCLRSGFSAWKEILA